ncbi:unnamed protein product [Ilex paraguariensis]|uniref:BSD domain-containing protein n=1 Tax=Ilex paraguariensis TaxID=185542 RepID=A0ABC8SQR3_9AQUA
MTDGQVIKRARYKSSVKDFGVPSVLKMTRERFFFMPNDPKSSARLNVEFRLVKGHKFTKEGSNKQALLNLTVDQGGNYIFEFDTFSDRDACREYVATAIAVSGEAGRAGSERSAAPLQDEQLSHAEMERRIRLLQEDSELQKLHKQLVIGGVLSEAEFWATRNKLLDENASRKSKQQVGLRNDMFHVKPSSDGSSNKVTFNLTPEIIHQIFAEKPAVRQTFLNFVPSKMTEKEFWTKYSRAEYLHSTKNVVVAAAEAAEDDKQDDMAASEARRKPQIQALPSRTTTTHYTLQPSDHQRGPPPAARPAEVSTNQRERLLMSTERLNKSNDRIRESRRTMLETEDLGVSLLQDLHQ